MSESTTLIASRDLDGYDPLVIASPSYRGGVAGDPIEPVLTESESPR
jgi:hypothetical protein